METAVTVTLLEDNSLVPSRSASFDKRILSRLATSILQRIPTRWELGHRATHGVLTRQAIAILAADGHQYVATWLRKYERELIRGLYWADEGWKCVSHFYHPMTGRGFLGWPNAVQMINQYEELARRWFTEGRMPEAAFYLGAAVHLVQDLCVPQHASSTIGHRHRAYEAAGEQAVSRYLVHSKGLYESWSPTQWIHANAAAAEAWMHEPSGQESGLGAMLERAQSTTAGYLQLFLSTVAAW